MGRAGKRGFHLRLPVRRPQQAATIAAHVHSVHMLGTILIILLILALVGALPGAPWMSNLGYGYAPSGLLGVILVVVVVLLLLGRI